MSGKIEGTIISITDEGNLVSDISADRLNDVPRNDSVTVRCDEHETLGIFTTDHGEPESTFIAVLGDSGNLELEIVGLSAKIMLGISAGEKITVKW